MSVQYAKSAEGLLVVTKPQVQQFDKKALTDHLANVNLNIKQRQDQIAALELEKTATEELITKCTDLGVVEDLAAAKKVVAEEPIA